MCPSFSFEKYYRLVPGQKDVADNIVFYMPPCIATMHGYIIYIIKYIVNSKTTPYVDNLY